MMSPVGMATSSSSSKMSTPAACEDHGALEGEGSQLIQEVIRQGLSADQISQEVAEAAQTVGAFEQLSAQVRRPACDGEALGVPLLDLRSQPCVTSRIGQVGEGVPSKLAGCFDTAEGTVRPRSG